METVELKHIIKRSGQKAEYDKSKIYEAIKKSAQGVFVISDELNDQLISVTRKVDRDLRDLGTADVPINMVQSAVEFRLLDAGLTRIAEQYIEYRIQRDLDRFGYENQLVAKLTFHRVH